MKIYNILSNYEITVDFTFIPSTKERHSSVIAKMDFNWFAHANQCKDCNAFINDFGSDTRDWKFKHADNIYYIDLKNFNSKDFHANKCKYESGDNGEYTSIKFILKK